MQPTRLSGILKTTTTEKEPQLVAGFLFFFSILSDENALCSLSSKTPDACGTKLFSPCKTVTSKPDHLVKLSKLDVSKIVTFVVTPEDPEAFSRLSDSESPSPGLEEGAPGAMVLGSRAKPPEARSRREAFSRARTQLGGCSGRTV